MQNSFRRGPRSEAHLAKFSPEFVLLSVRGGWAQRRIRLLIFILQAVRHAHRRQKPAARMRIGFCEGENDAFGRRRL
jgi:hypothetical protein